VERAVDQKLARVRWFGLGLMVLAPFVADPMIMNAEHLGHWHNQTAELFVWIAAVVLGVYGLWLLPLPVLVRSLLTLPYLALAAVFTFVYGATVGCAYFGDCL
jgi:hypothetical protein